MKIMPWKRNVHLLSVEPANANVRIGFGRVDSCTQSQARMWIAGRVVSLSVITASLSLSCSLSYLFAPIIYVLIRDFYAASTQSALAHIDMARTETSRAAKWLLNVYREIIYLLVWMVFLPSCPTGHTHTKKDSVQRMNIARKSTLLQRINSFVAEFMWVSGLHGRRFLFQSMKNPNSGNEKFEFASFFEKMPAIMMAIYCRTCNRKLQEI